MTKTLDIGVTLKETDRTTILLGFLIGSARHENYDLDITGSGKTLRFRCKTNGVMREFDLDLREIAEAVINECVETTQ